MKNLFLLLISIIPSLIILKIVYKRDSQKEPMSLLIALFGVGILSVFAVFFLSMISSVIFPRIASGNIETLSIFEIGIYSFIFVALFEEGVKWTFTYSIIFNHKEFDQIYDSIVYSVFLSLGFATFENVLYVFQNGYSVGIFRAITAVPSHAFFAIAMGYYIGFSKLSYINKNYKLEKKYRIYSLIIPVLLHGMYDFCLLSQNLLLIIAFAAFVIYLYVSSIRKVKQFERVKNNLY